MMARALCSLAVNDVEVANTTDAEEDGQPESIRDATSERNFGPEQLRTRFCPSTHSI